MEGMAHLGREESSYEVEGNDEEDETVEVLDGEAGLKSKLLERALACEQLQECTQNTVKQCLLPRHRHHPSMDKHWFNKAFMKSAEAQRRSILFCQKHWPSKSAHCMGIENSCIAVHGKGRGY